MIIVKGAIPVKPEQHEQALALVQQLARVSREERGCLAYDVYLLAEEPNTIVVWQQWDSLNALEAHFSSDHVDSFLDAIPDLIEGDVTSAQFDVQQAIWDEYDDGMELPRVHYADNLVLH